MIETENRFFLSKSGNASIGEARLRVPNVLFAAEEGGDSYPAGFEALLAPAPLDTQRVQFIASRNEMLHGERRSAVAGNTVTMPNFIPFSSLIQGIGKSYERDRTGPVFVALGRNESLLDELKGVGSDIVEISNSPEIARDPYDMALTLVSARRALGFNRLLYAPGVASPLNLSLLIYAGADLVDSTAADLDALAGRVHAGGLAYGAAELEQGICSCTACTERGRDWQLWHTRLQMLDELRRCRLAIAAGNLREHVEARCAASPWNTEFLRYLDTMHYDFVEQFVPDANTAIRAATEHSLSRPDILRYVRRFGERYTPPHLSIALLVPCSNRKPYYLSKSHRLFEDAVRRSHNSIQVHVVTVTSPLGIVPEELETVFPAANYDIAVTGHWSGEEVERSESMLRKLLSDGSYTTVISHLADERGFVNSMLEREGIGYVDTSLGNTRSAESLKRLTDAVNEAGRLQQIGWEKRMKEMVANLCAFQFGEPGRALLEGSRLTGRYPNLRIMREGVQLGMLTGARGVVSLTLDGAEAIAARTEDFSVHIDRFKLKGNIFAAGVLGAGKSVRIGDEAVVCRDGAVVAVGVASMSGPEMSERGKGEAVHVRHARKE